MRKWSGPFRVYAARLRPIPTTMSCNPTRARAPREIRPRTRTSKPTQGLPAAPRQGGEVMNAADRLSIVRLAAVALGLCAALLFAAELRRCHGPYLRGRVRPRATALPFLG